MPLFRRLAVLATAAEAARRYAKSNPDKAARFVDQAAQFVDKQTKGKYSGQIHGAASKAKSVAGIRPTRATARRATGPRRATTRTPGTGRPLLPAPQRAAPPAAGSLRSERSVAQSGQVSGAPSTSRTARPRRGDAPFVCADRRLPLGHRVVSGWRRESVVAP